MKRVDGICGWVCYWSVGWWSVLLKCVDGI